MRGGPIGLVGRRHRTRRDQTPTPHLRRLAKRWWIFLLLGIAGVVIGAILIVDVATAVTTLALLVGLSLLVTGLLDLSTARRYSPTWLGVLSGVLALAAGVIAMLWPDVTLKMIAVVAGGGLVVEGVLRIVGGLSDRSYRWWSLLVLVGVLSVVVGGAALVWPNITILALALLLGIRTVVLGMTEIGYALFLRKVGVDFS